jgi:NhaP-type Na+/H+ or K+/H+ antiporter
VKGVFVQALLLAGPGVGIGAVLTGCFVKAMPLGWSWNFAMAFGSILSATDPVAVVALLKNAGASPKLTILIIGESLMNDGTAMVLFGLFFNMMKGEEYTGGDVVLYFLKMALGAPLLGMSFGLVAVWLLGKADRVLTKDDTTIQIAITFCTAYLVFYTAEWECEISGVLACCGAGCMLAWKAPPLILEPETMHHVWGMIEWAANTVIFMLAGLIIGKESIHRVEAIDWLYLLILYLVLSIIRVIVVTILYPGIKHTGLKCSFKDAVFVSWAGLRGALAMSLAVIFKNSKDINISNLDGHRVLFFVGGIAALTIIINGMSSSWVLDKLGLLTGDDSPDKVLVLKQVQRRLRKKSFEYVVDLAKQMHIRDPADVVKFNTLLKNFIKASGNEDGTIRLSMRHSETDDRVSTGSRTKSVFNVYGFEVKDGDKLMSPLSEGNNARAMSRASEWLLNMRRGSTEPVMKDLHIYVRTVFLEILRAQYWKYIEDGKLPRESYATQTLLYSIENALDRVHKVSAL